MHINEVGNMKVADLKRELKLRGLSVVGNKTELQERLQAAMENEPSFEDSSLVGEDILDEEGVLSDEEKILGSDENELLKSPKRIPTTSLPKTLEIENKGESAIDDDILESPTTVTKKIVLKRKSSLNCIISTDANAKTTKENTEPSAAKAVKMSERKPITMSENKKVDSDQGGAAATKKLSELTMQERLELRAKKFGIETKASVATTTPPMTAKDKNGAISVAPVLSSEKQVEILKKRAERFGCVTSTNLAKLDAEERLLKRKQRFGGEVETATKIKIDESENSSTAATKTTTDNGSDEWVEKARKRLERFKGNVTSPVSSEVADNSALTVSANSA